ncbi:uncharacterized protein LOC131026758 isoform X1 [Cryptomeria japonica]|uniref:uncharacterized protein LOC131026758 isoform X1 n=1 Tax=Cryptomeria japonica TaxID=3369 RepID=UPI0027DA6EEE|nr:uncharacterized protein LOC131026758 isoform X1 [Cryptomeria japonica]
MVKVEQNDASVGIDHDPCVEFAISPRKDAEKEADVEEKREIEEELKRSWEEEWVLSETQVESAVDFASPNEEDADWGQEHQPFPKRHFKCRILSCWCRQRFEDTETKITKSRLMDDKVWSFVSREVPVLLVKPLSIFEA